MIARRPFRGFTLIELMAVIVIVTLVTGIVTVSVVGGADNAKVREAAGIWRDMDRRARVMALDIGAVSMHVDAGRARLDLRSGDGDDSVVAETALPDGVVAVLSPVSIGSVVTYDGSGRSDDYQVRLRCGEREVGWSVHGLTGFVAESDA